MHSGLVVLLRHLTMRKNVKTLHKLHQVESCSTETWAKSWCKLCKARVEFQDSKIICCEPSRPIGLYLQNCRSTTHNLTLVNRRILS